MDAVVRLKNEFKNLQKNLTYGCYMRPISNTWMKWDGQIHHKGSFYKISMVFTKQYPSKPPVVKFISPIYNPNVYATGVVCLDLISTTWSPALTISDILGGLIQLIQYPNPLSPANIAAGQDFAKNLDVYYEKAEKTNESNKFYAVQGYYQS